MHGLWPSGTPADICKWPQDCTSEKYDQSSISSSTLSKMNTYWVGLYSSDEAFRAHEYEKHGTCWVNDVGSSNKQENYMEKIMEIHDKYNIVETLEKNSLK